MKPFSKKRRVLILALLLTLITLIPFVSTLMKRIGKNPTGERLQQIKQSPHYKNDAFQNPQPTEVMRKDASPLDLAKDFFARPASVRPSKPLPSVKTDLKKISSEKPSIVWFGHSSYLIHSKGFTILVDPVFSGHASPVSFFGKAFEGADVYGISDFPTIDLLILTHDHYDHLDYQTVLQFKDKVKQIVTSLGVGSHLENWGFDPGKITELDWNDSAVPAKGIQVTATPARHFSGRSLVRAKTLWSAFVLQLHEHKLFLGGDSGYGDHFKAIGDEHGPFDLALLENGQYGNDWPNIHMFPEEMAKAAADLRTAMILPVHWAKFTLSNHPWNEPIKRLFAANHPIAITVPKIGELYTLGDPVKSEVWWDFV